MDALSITLGVVLAHLGEGYIDHPISFATQNLASAEKNYTITEKGGLEMMYAL